MVLSCARAFLLAGGVSLLASVCIGLGGLCGTQVLAQSASRPSTEDAKYRERAAQLTERGARFLLSTQQRDGGWDSETGPGISAIVLKALVQEKSVGPAHPAVRRGVEFVLGFQRPGGGISSPEGLLTNYESAVALSMLAALDDPRYADKVAALQESLKTGQWDEGEDKSPNDPWYGGAGYGPHKRPDMSNTQMMLEALHDSGLPKDDPAYKKALLFIQRCQMDGELNDQPLAKGSTQGGFIYTPARGGESKAGTIDVGGRAELRCYGSMTYAAFKSMLHAGLTRDDPRVSKALDWIRRHWTLDFNPNMPDAQSREGLFYYYHVLARTLDAWGEGVVRDHTDREHAWRHELVDALARLQRPDGRWVNDADRWMEGRPTLTTAYALLALQAAYPASE